MFKCKYCQKECKNNNSLRNHERLCKENPNRQYTPFHNQDFQEKYRENHYTKAKRLNLPKPEPYNKGKPGTMLGKTHSEETKQKISKARIKYLNENPDKVPYKLNHSSKESYPEKYFRELFEKEGLNLNKQYSVGIYSLDFALVENKIDIEIDGDQHYLDPKIVEIDKRRNDYLTSLGWKIIRVKWSDYKKLIDKEKKQYIIKLLNEILDL